MRKTINIALVLYLTACTPFTFEGITSRPPKKPTPVVIAVDAIQYEVVYDAPAPAYKYLVPRFAHDAWLLTGKPGSLVDGKWKIVRFLPFGSPPQEQIAQLNQFASEGWDYVAILTPPPSR